MRIPSLALAIVAAATLAPAPSAAADGEFPFRDGDRVVFLGDSITEQMRWTRHVAQAVALRSPGADIRFFNAGWGGDTAKGGLDRLQRDVLALKPTAVVICYGMNDGGYRPPDPAVTASYRENLAGIVSKLKAAGARAVVLSPGCVDGVARPNLAQARYDETLEGLARAAQSVAKEAGAVFVDVHRPMREFLAARREAGIGESLIPDGVHPAEEGHLVMSAAILQGIGAGRPEPLGVVDAGTGRGHGISVVSKDAGGLVLRCDGPVQVPFAFDPAHERTVRTSGLAAIVGPEIRVTGLAAGSWELTFDDDPAGTLSSADLAKGVPLLVGASRRGHAVADFTQRREARYHHAWREVRIGDDLIPGATRAFEGLMELDAGFAFRARDAAKPLAGAEIRLSRAPEGENVARGRPYECSDPNPHRWGEGGLTDGSWEPTPQDCFATGAEARLPKSVTVDLGRAFRVGGVRVGVPPFGSTRTVKVSVGATGKDMKEVGSATFEQRKADRRTLTFPPASARFVRLTFPDRWPETVQFPPEFAFVTELEVYAQ